MLIAMLILFAYLVGSVPTALVVGKIGFKLDIREHGSGNLGATNAFRVLGIKAGIIVTIGDILKGTIATVLPIYFDTGIHPLFIGIFAVIGHTYPLFAKFKGGKAVATSAGLILGVSPLLFIIVLAIFILTLYLTKYVSLSSIITSFIGSILAILIYQDWVLFAVLFALTCFVIYRHLENLKRIKNKTEPKITWL